MEIISAQRMTVFIAGGFRSDYRADKSTRCATCGMLPTPTTEFQTVHTELAERTTNYEQGHGMSMSINTKQQPTASNTPSITSKPWSRRVSPRGATLVVQRVFQLRALLGLLAIAQVVIAKEPTNSVAFDWSAADAQPEQAAHILKQLRAWREPSRPRDGKKLRVIYFHPRDRQPLKNHVERWDRIMADFQQFYRDEMQRLGYGEVTISLEHENGKLKLHEVRGTAKDDGSYSYRSGGRIHGEVAKALATKGINANAETLLIVCGLSKTEGKQVTIYSPYYGMGANHDKGVCLVADSDWLTIDGLKPDNKGVTLRVKEHRGYEPFTLPRFNTTYIGGTIHELGHGLSLPHARAAKWESRNGTALMGAGNYTYRKEWRNEGKGSFLAHAHAVRLLVHPLFSGTSQQRAKPPNPRLTELTASFHDDEIHVRGIIHADVPAIAMIAYNDGENRGQKGYQVNNDYDATTWTSVVNPQKEFWIRVGDLKDGNHQLRLLSVHANGATVVNRLHYTLKDGVPDFSRANKEIAKIIAQAASQPTQ
ncbi:MAG: hypothetical protein N2C14_08585 [Planctomycetales bacterium]